MTIKTRYLGICPVCQKEYKLNQGVNPSEAHRLVHHGYQRPGYGYIVGDCFGVGYPAYQLSKLGCEEYLTAVQSQLERERKNLQDIDSGAAKEAWVKRRVSFGQSELVRVTAEDPKFIEALKIFRVMVEATVVQCEREIKRMGKLIAEWQPKEPRTIEEATQETDALKAARKAERDAKRTAAQTKAAERKAVVAAREAERQALIAKYKLKFETLASGLESVSDRKRQARWDWVDMNKSMRKRAYLHFYPKALECDEALQTLGLADPPRTDGYVRYADSNGLL
jgi:hypothetical protein